MAKVKSKAHKRGPSNRIKPVKAVFVVALSLNDNDREMYDKIAADPPPGVVVTPSYVLRRALALAVEHLEST